MLKNAFSGKIGDKKLFIDSDTWIFFILTTLGNFILEIHNDDFPTVEVRNKKQALEILNKIEKLRPKTKEVIEYCLENLK